MDAISIIGIIGGIFGILLLIISIVVLCVRRTQRSVQLYTRFAPIAHAPTITSAKNVNTSQVEEHASAKRFLLSANSFPTRLHHTSYEPNLNRALDLLHKIDFEQYLTPALSTQATEESGWCYPDAEHDFAKMQEPVLDQKELVRFFIYLYILQVYAKEIVSKSLLLLHRAMCHKEGTFIEMNACFVKTMREKIKNMKHKDEQDMANAYKIVLDLYEKAKFAKEPCTRSEFHEFMNALAKVVQQ